MSQACLMQAELLEAERSDASSLWMGTKLQPSG